jgi:hypothetical protein
MDIKGDKNKLAWKELDKDKFGTGIEWMDFIEIKKKKWILVAHGNIGDELTSTILLISYPDLEI